LFLIQLADKELETTRQKYAVGEVSPADYDRAKMVHDMTVAGLQNNPNEQERLKLKIADFDLDVAKKKLAVGCITQSEFDWIKLGHDAEVSHYKLMQTGAENSSH